MLVTIKGTSIIACTINTLFNGQINFLKKYPILKNLINSFQVKYIYYFQQGMGILHCAAQNNHVEVMNFIFESLENMNINEGEMVNYSDNLKKIKKKFLWFGCNNLDTVPLIKDMDLHWYGLTYKTFSTFICDWISNLN